MQYFYLIPKEKFQDRLVPAITSSWRSRNINDLAQFRRQLVAGSGGRAEDNPRWLSDLQLGTKSRAFRPEVWRILVAEVLLSASAELPEIETPLESWARLMGQDLAESRLQFSPVQQAILGARDLFLGSYYRPENSGWNDYADVRQLSAWLRTLHQETWRAEALTHVPTGDQEEELSYAREWFEQFAAMYQRAEQAKFVIVCEQI
jgi:hypothetical protein